MHSLLARPGTGNLSINTPENVVLQMMKCVQKVMDFILNMVEHIPDILDLMFCMEIVACTHDIQAVDLARRHSHVGAAPQIRPIFQPKIGPDRAHFSAQNWRNKVPKTREKVPKI